MPVQMANCDTCGAPGRELWPPAGHRPSFETVDIGNWIALERCPPCGALWVEVPHEPYGSFPYRVRWPRSVADWRALYDRDEGETLHAWHAYGIGRGYPGLSAGDRRQVDAHVVRACGRAPWERGRPVDLDALLPRAP